MRVVTLASGSKGNCLLAESGQTRILIDNGLSLKALTGRLTTVGVESDTIDAVVVSHNHTDHISGVSLLARRWRLPVYITEATMGAIEKAQATKRRRSAISKPKSAKDQWPADRIRSFEAGSPFSIGDLEIVPFSVPHDAADTVAFTVGDGDRKVGVLSDLGTATTVVKSHLKGCEALFMEFNHDIGLLEEGPYPWALKQRVKSRHGHLSNLQAARLLKELIHERLKSVVLTHLSEMNNRPSLAIKAASSVLAESGATEAVTLGYASQHQPGNWVVLNSR